MLNVIIRWGDKMPMDYAKLFDVMKANDLTSYKIRKDKIISERSLQALRENRAVNTDTICALCRVLGCQPGDLMKYVDDDK